MNDDAGAIGENIQNRLVLLPVLSCMHDFSTVLLRSEYHSWYLMVVRKNINQDFFYKK